MRAALLATIVFATPVLAQAPAAETKPSDERTTAQKARAPLKLRLDELNGPIRAILLASGRPMFRYRTDLHLWAAERIREVSTLPR